MYLSEENKQALLAYLRRQRWFGGKARAITAITEYRSFLLGTMGRMANCTLVQVDYQAGEPELYLLLLAFAPSGSPIPAQSIIAENSGSEQQVLYDALGVPRFCAWLLETIGYIDER